ncbi:hypothetical protein O9A_00099 [Bartonella koehlerae C-29]|uniref:Uncharacterized protein n=1 Tax=Bartonella koehlerae C-29 TaxID=1134510 RepID=A0A067W8W4_9HYPH|nr:hypothetical protein O9A_00099 [Bartonella koehlerae C-29]
MGEAFAVEEAIGIEKTVSCALSRNTYAII